MTLQPGFEMADPRSAVRISRTVRVAALVVSAWLMSAAIGIAAVESPQRPNVLFIAVDDLRPQLGCYGVAKMVTPSLDKLASEGRRFERHYVQVPTCGASRFALLTGHYPTGPETYDNNAFQSLHELRAEPLVSLPQLFRQSGYSTVAIGKISHSPDGALPDGTAELPESWDEFGCPHAHWENAWAAFFAYAAGKTRIVRETPVSERADVNDRDYPDGLIAEAAIDKLQALATQDRPFFLAVGFFKPHLPFSAPAKYWDLYQPDDFPAPSHTRPPKNVDPEISLHKSGEMRGQYTGFSTPGIVTKSEGRHLRHAYAACVSYTDAQVGRVLSELDRLGLRENTIVVVWGDHGWHLGEHGIWGKHTLHEVAMRSPLLVRAPHVESPGEPADGLVETVDIYPTLCELCGLTAPADVDGQSFAAMLADPAAPGKPAIYGFWRRGRGHSIRTPHYRLIEWTDGTDRSRRLQTELYDLQLDADETTNIAAEQPEIVDELSAKLHRAVLLLRQD